MRPHSTLSLQLEHGLHTPDQIISLGVPVRFRLPAGSEVFNQNPRPKSSGPPDIKTMLVHSRLERLETAVQATQDNQAAMHADLKEVHSMLRMLIPAVQGYQANP